MALSPKLIRKYNQPVPRYTSCPTVPLWDNGIDLGGWGKTVKTAFGMYGKREGINLYIHVPFCENLCTYFGCTKRITKSHKVKDSYKEAILTAKKPERNQVGRGVSCLKSQHQGAQNRKNF